MKLSALWTRIISTIFGVGLYLLIVKLEFLPSFPTDMRGYLGHAMIYVSSVTLFLHLISVINALSGSRQREQNFLERSAKEIL